MMSSHDIEKLIAEKRRQIEQEKSLLGLSPTVMNPEDEVTEESIQTTPRQVSFSDNQEFKRSDEKSNKTKKLNKENLEYDDNVSTKRSRLKSESKDRRLCESKREGRCSDQDDKDFEIPPDLDRYIRRYLGLPVMLKAGEFSPNNPLLRGERAPGDVLLGLGEYERRRNTLRKIRQQQYREYLDQQAKKKQEEKQRLERERREREEKERQKEEEERQRFIEDSPGHRRASVCYVAEPKEAKEVSKHVNRSKVDTGVQVGVGRPLSVAVQTDDDLYQRLSPSPTKSQLTQAERELSPRTVECHDERPIQPAGWVRARDQKWDERRRSYTDFDERASYKKSNREKLVSDLQHTYMPSVLDADAIHMRNQLSEKEALERRQFYRQELKNQIQEQQRIREERKSREKMLELAEMRRLEEQLRMLRAAQTREEDTLRCTAVKEQQNAADFEQKRTALQKDIDLEQQTLYGLPKRTATSQSDTAPSKLPFYNPRKPFSTNIPKNSIFNPNYDVESYLRKNLNPSRETLFSSRLDKGASGDNNIWSDRIERLGENQRPSHSERHEIESRDRNEIQKPCQFESQTHERPSYNERPNESDRPRNDRQTNIHNVTVEVHERPKENRYEPSVLTRNVKNYDEIIPVLKHRNDDISVSKYGNEKPVSKDDEIASMSHRNEDFVNDMMRNDDDDEVVPAVKHSSKLDDGLSEAMKKVDSKWKVPVVQKNILKTLPNEDGKSVNILTQLGSIRRQLQLEQLRLDGLSHGDT